MKRTTLLIVAIAQWLWVAAQTYVKDETDGTPVAYASVFSGDGNFLGSTSLEGRLPDVGGARTISITHLAYQPVQLSTIGMGSEIRMKPADIQLGDVVYEKPQSYCICLTGYARSYTLGRLQQNKYDVLPSDDFLDGIVRVYLFLDGKTITRQAALMTRDCRTGKLLFSPYKAVGIPYYDLSAKTVIKTIEESANETLKPQSDGLVTIERKSTEVGQIQTDPHTQRVRISYDKVTPDDEYIRKVAFLKLHYKEDQVSYLYRAGESGEVAQCNLLGLYAREYVQTHALKDSLLFDSFHEFYVDKVEFLTKADYKKSLADAKSYSKARLTPMSTEELNAYIVDHHIPDIPAEVATKMAMSEQLMEELRERRRK